MCGFVGILNLNGKSVNENLLTKMRDTMHHRGPDDEGTFISGPVGLGFRRLSIIDLSTGRQPMFNPDGTICIVFNGEIYNYIELRNNLREAGRVFRTGSDTEVILHLYETYGRDCVHHLNGMFSFVIWDERRKEMFAARDRLGVKPLYYFVDEERIILASEIKAILTDSEIRRIPNYHSIMDYLNFMYVLGDKTFFKGIKKLLPGHRLLITQEGKVSIDQYWDVEYGNLAVKSEEKIARDLYDLLNDSVRIHLRSDVPLGCHLSGGLDSSTVVSLSSKIYNGTSPIKTFSGKFKEDPFYDETPYAKIIAGKTGAEYHETIPSAELFPDIIERLVWYMDEPSVGPGIYPQYFVCQLASQNVKVVLGGQGGDELFGGYPRYFLASNFAGSSTGEQQTKNLFFLINYAKRHGLKRTLAKGAGFLKIKSGGQEDRWKFFSKAVGDTKSLIGPALFRESRNYDQDDQFFQYIRKDNATHLFDKLLYHDLKAYLPGLLQVEDRTSMAVSLESRVPLLDYRIVEYAAGIPPEIKVKNGNMKYILKKAVRGLLPDEIIERNDKKGFPTPINVWFKGKLSGYLKNILLDERTLSRGLFDRKALSGLLSSKVDNSWTLWALLNVELWFRTFIDDFKRPEGGS